ncbi:MAG TPA: cysteine dioxygenase family protein [Rhodanobacteraceae bacterium]|nr:cysteine dioxygenase family protein [Rhodanobacteraceae bacterium]
MTPIDLDVTRSVRAYMMSCLESGDFNLDRVQQGLRDAAWYSPRDRRALRALCDRNPSTLTRWLFGQERSGRYTGLIMIWPPGYTTPVHDHDGLWGIEWVLQGALGVDDYALVDDADGSVQPRFVRTTLLEEGQSCAFLGTRDHAHRCCNPSTRRTSITLHLYGGLLEMYRNYEQHAADGRFVALPGTARVDGEIGNALHA